MTCCYISRYEMETTIQNIPIYLIFRYFHFPLYVLKKIQYYNAEQKTQMNLVRLSQVASCLLLWRDLMWSSEFSLNHIIDATLC